MSKTSHAPYGIWRKSRQCYGRPASPFFRGPNARRCASSGRAGSPRRGAQISKIWGSLSANRGAMADMVEYLRGATYPMIFVGKLRTTPHPPYQCLFCALIAATNCPICWGIWRSRLALSNGMDFRRRMRDQVPQTRLGRMRKKGHAPYFIAQTSQCPDFPQFFRIPLFPRSPEFHAPPELPDPPPPPRFPRSSRVSRVPGDGEADLSNYSGPRPAPNFRLRCVTGPPIHT